MPSRKIKKKRNHSLWFSHFELEHFRYSSWRRVISFFFLLYFSTEHYVFQYLTFQTLNKINTPNQKLSIGFLYAMLLWHAYAPSNPLVFRNSHISDRAHLISCVLSERFLSWTNFTSIFILKIIFDAFILLWSLCIWSSISWAVDVVCTNFKPFLS